MTHISNDLGALIAEFIFALLGDDEREKIQHFVRAVRELWETVTEILRQFASLRQQLALK